MEEISSFLLDVAAEFREFWAVASPVLVDGRDWVVNAVFVALSWPLESLLLVLLPVVLAICVRRCLRSCFGASRGKVTRRCQPGRPHANGSSTTDSVRSESLSLPIRRRQAEPDDGVHVSSGVPAAILPAGWQTAQDPHTCKPYYFNDATGEVSWMPWTCFKTQDYPPSIAEVAAGLPYGWETACDLDTGKPYYFNHGTGEVSWTRPVSAPRNWVSMLLPHHWCQRKNGKHGKNEEASTPSKKPKSCLKTPSPRGTPTRRRKASISADTPEPAAMKTRPRYLRPRSPASAPPPYVPVRY